MKTERKTELFAEFAEKSSRFHLTDRSFPCRGQTLWQEIFKQKILKIERIWSSLAWFLLTKGHAVYKWIIFSSGPYRDTTAGPGDPVNTENGTGLQ
ncbi:MAG: hypothetical protein LBJ31_06910 [Treponema sp.]|jgi:hypothetical protein|nr:hypothetical protein [Treponema sp.]